MSAPPEELPQDLPQELLLRLGQTLPAPRLAAALRARSGPRRIALRVNTLRTSVERAESALAAAGIAVRRVGWLADALVVLEGGVAQVQATPAFAGGHVHIQSLSSIAVGHAVAPQPGHRVLDACAAPGSKTSHMAALMGNAGTLIAADSSRDRVFRLRAVLQGLGAEAQCMVERAERWGRRAPDSFDCVLVDVPCSAEGRALAGDAAAARGWTPRKCRALASRQKAILHGAIQACKPGGSIVYSTCTLGREENEDVLARALQVYRGRIALEEIPAHVPCALPVAVEQEATEGGPDLHAASRAAMRIAPCDESVHPDGPWLEGFFVARLRRLE